MAVERKRGDRGSARTELVAVRFDPRTRFALDLAARAQRRSIANYVEWAVEQSFKSVDMGRPDGQAETVEAAAAVLWHLSESVRLARLLHTNSHLLTFDEQKLLKLVHAATSVLEIRGNEDAQAELIQPHWNYLKDAAAKELTTEEVARELLEERKKQQLVTVERIDKRIAELGAKHKKDIEWLQAEKKKLQAPAKT